MWKKTAQTVWARVNVVVAKNAIALREERLLSRGIKIACNASQWDEAWQDALDVVVEFFENLDLRTQDLRLLALQF